MRGYDASLVVVSSCLMDVIDVFVISGNFSIWIVLLSGFSILNVMCWRV